MKMIDIIVPCKNEGEVLNQFFEEVNYQMRNYQWKLILIDDGSKDNTLNIMKKLANDYSNVKYISFSRNFGKEAAIYAGLQHSTGDYVILMDADLQDPPQLIPKMIEDIEKGYDIVATRRVTREGEPILRSFGAKTFYKIINKFSDVDIVDGARDFRIMQRYVVDSILQLEEYSRFSKGIFQWVGYKTKWIEYRNIERRDGETSWSFWNLVTYSIEGIVSFTTAPLHIATILGLIISLIAFIALIYIVIRTLIYGNPVDGWPSLASIILFIGGIQLLTIGILGKYMSKIYLESKKRPIYIIKEKN